MEEIGYAIKQIMAGEIGVSVTDLITDLLDFMGVIEKFGEHCEKSPFIIAGKGKDAEPLIRLLSAIRQFKDSITPGKTKKYPGTRVSLLKKPVGPSKLGGYNRQNEWNNSAWGSTGPIECQICGTTHPKKTDGESYTVSCLLGLQVVEKCCGAVLDRIYEESKHVFLNRLLWEFANNPADPELKFLPGTIRKVLKVAKEKLAEVSAVVGEISETAKAL